MANLDDRRSEPAYHLPIPEVVWDALQEKILALRASVAAGEVNAFSAQVTEALRQQLAAIEDFCEAHGRTRRGDPRPDA